MADPIVEQYCRRHPARAAGRLHGSPLADVQALVADLPVTVAGAVLARLGSHQLSACLRDMEAPLVAQIIAGADHDDSVELIAHLANERYDELVGAARDEGGVLGSRLYAYARRTLGSIANPSFVRVQKGTLCGSVKADLSAAGRDRDDPVYLTDEKGVLLGMVPLLAVIADKNASEPVDALAITIAPLSDRTTIGSALEARQWASATVLPVVDAGQRLLGTVSRQQLLRLTHRDSPQVYGLDQLATDLASEYVETCASLLELVVQGRSR